MVLSPPTPSAASAPARTGPGLPTRLRAFLSGQRLLLLAVGLVVAVVSLPLLRSLALKENELDALRALDLLGREAFAAEAAPATVGDLLAEGSELAARLPDTRLLDEGRLMFHHGYLFDLVPTPAGGRALRAWPLAHGETGLGAFWSDAPGRCLGHPNRAATWSGLDLASEALADPQDPASSPGWRPVRTPRARTPGG